MNDRIGTWVKREKRPYWHYVESLIADDAVTTCGRRLRDEANARGVLLFTDDPGPKCKTCSRG